MITQHSTCTIWIKNPLEEQLERAGFPWKHLAPEIFTPRISEVNNYCHLLETNLHSLRQAMLQLLPSSTQDWAEKSIPAQNPLPHREGSASQPKGRHSSQSNWLYTNCQMQFRDKQKKIITPGMCQHPALTAPGSTAGGATEQSVPLDFSGEATPPPPNGKQLVWCSPRCSRSHETPVTAKSCYSVPLPNVASHALSPTKPQDKLVTSSPAVLLRQWHVLICFHALHSAWQLARVLRLRSAYKSVG